MGCKYEFGGIVLIDKKSYNTSWRDNAVEFSKEKLREYIEVDESTWVVKEYEETKYINKENGHYINFVGLTMPHINPYDYEPVVDVCIEVRCKGIKKGFKKYGEVKSNG